MGETHDATKRFILGTKGRSFLPYDRYGKTISGLSWIPLSEDPELDRTSYLLRFDPGARSMPHEHGGIEEFFVLEGELHDSDGTRFREGDFVRFDAGSRHWSQSPEGCVILVTLLGQNRLLEAE